MHPRQIIFLLFFASLAALALSLAVGSVSINSQALWSVISGQGDAISRSLVMELRLPRSLSAFFTGAMLALAGALMQVLLRNPLADPYILGISGGAGVAVLLSMLAGMGGLVVTGSAFVGALLSTLLVFGIARTGQGWTPTRLLLTGVVIAMGWGAVISFILAISPDQQLRGMLFWLMGDLSYSQLPYTGIAILVIALAVMLPHARDLNVLTRSELHARSLGVAVEPIRLRIYLIASLLTAGAVIQGGSIGFVGLVVPHMLRLMGCHDHRFLIPAAILFGGCLVVLADTLARTLIAPQQLPVGIITAFIGVPLFLYLLGRRHR